MKKFDHQKIAKELKIDARALGIPSGSANLFIERTIKAANKNLSDKTIITQQDLDRAIIKELKKYNADLAYVYQNRGKII